MSTNLSYLAGIVDGEGCISLEKRENNNYRIVISVANTDGRLIDWIFENFGGRIKIHNRGEIHKKSWKWIITGQKAISLIKDIIPFLIVKKNQAELILLLDGKYINYGRGKQELRGVPTEIMEERSNLYIKLRDLKKENINPKFLKHA